MNGFHDLLIVMVVIWTTGKIFRSIHLPVVFGELAGGILVGPSVLHLVNPDSEVIRVLAELGIFFLMLHTGLTSNPHDLLRASGKSVCIALAGMAVPFVLGFGITRLFGYSTAVALFMGIGISSTSITLAAKFFKHCSLQHTRIAHLTLGAAILEDILTFALLSLFVTYYRTGALDVPSALLLLTKIGLFFFVVLFAGMRYSACLSRIIYFGNRGFTATLIIALLMGLIAETIGLHMVIGAFLAGLFLREECIDEKVFRKIEDRVYGLSHSFFGPIYFASLAFHLDVSTLLRQPAFLLCIISVAVVGKCIGSGVMARFLGIRPIESWIIGLAMNNRSTVELIIASVGLQLGIIDDAMFSTLVMMSFATTLLSILLMAPTARRLKRRGA